MIFCSVSVPAYAAEPNQHPNPAVIRLSPERAATLLLDFVDEMLAANNQEIPIPGYGLLGATKIRCTSINYLLSDVYSLITNPIVQLASFIGLGELRTLNVSAINPKNVQRIKGNSASDIKVIYAIIQLLNDNSNLIQKVLNGKADYGPAGGAIKDVIVIDLPSFTKDILYKMLINKDGKLPAAVGDSIYKDYTIDQLLNVYLRDFLTVLLPSLGDPKYDNIIDVAGMSWYKVFQEAFKVSYDEIFMDFFNKDVKMILADICDAHYNEETGLVAAPANPGALYKAINWSYKFTETTYNFERGYAEYGGIINYANELFCVMVKNILVDAEYKKLDLKPGSNDNLQANLEKLVRFILPNCPPEFFYEGFDMSRVSASAIAKMNLKSMGTLFLTGFLKGMYPESIIMPDKIEHLEQLIIVCLRAFFSQRAPQYNYDEQIFADFNSRTLAEKTQNQWRDLMLTMLVDWLCLYLDQTTGFGLNFEQVQKYKKAGWTWENFLDEIADWLLEFYEGISAQAIKSIKPSDRQRGKIDAMKPWFKINLIINSLIPLQFINGTPKTENGVTFVCDLEKLAKENLVGNLMSFNIRGVIDILAEPLPGAPKKEPNMNIADVPLATGVLIIVRHFINAMLPAADIPLKYTKDFDTFLNQDNFADTVARVIRALNSRKTEVVPTLLARLCGTAYKTLVPDTSPPPVTGDLNTLSALIKNIEDAMTNGDKSFAAVDMQHYRWKGLNKALLEARTLVDADSSDIDAVRRAQADLDAAYKIMFNLPREGGKTNYYLRAEYNYALAQGFKKAEYSAASWAAYEKALAEAKRVLDAGVAGTGISGKVSQTAIGNTMMGLQLAVNSLIRREDAADLTELNSLISMAGGILINRELFTTDNNSNFTLLESARDTAAALAGEPGLAKRRQGEVDAAADALKAELAKFTTSVRLNAKSGSGAAVTYKNGMNYITGVKSKVTEAELKSTYLSASGPAGVSLSLSLSNTDKGIGTGTVVNVINSKSHVLAAAVLCIKGDVTGDGGADMFDIAFTDLVVNKKKSVQGAYLMAIDFNADGRIDYADLAALKTMLKK